MSELNYTDIKEMYEEKKMSWEEIANQYGTYPNKIIRFVKSNGGVQKRSRSEAQSISLEKGNREHPTKGKKRSDEVKSAIAKKQADNWENLSEKDKKHRSDVAKENWKNKTPEEIENMQKLAIQGVLKASKSGSKFENFVADSLIKDGYTIETHKESFIEQENVHIDIFLPYLSLAIEIDGPAHFLPIWGEEKLMKHKHKDDRKNALLLHIGLTVLRVKCLVKNISQIKMEKIYGEILENIKKIEVDPKQYNNTMIEIEVK